MSILRNPPPPPAKRAEDRYGKLVRYRRRKNRHIFVVLESGVATDTVTIATRTGSCRRTIGRMKLMVEFEELVACACGRHHAKRQFKGCARARA